MGFAGKSSIVICRYLKHFLSSSSKNKKNPPLEKLLIFQEMEFSGSNIKKILIFSYISGNRNPKKALHISGNGALQPKLKKI